jgi:hypothetical protein
MKNHNRPKQRIFDTAVFPRKTELPVIRDDCNQEKPDYRCGDQPGQKSGGKTKAARHLHDADDVRPKQCILESHTFQKFRGSSGIPEQDWEAMNCK